jgi:hypothetical protein
MAVEKAKPRTIVRGFRTYLSGIGDLLLALLLIRLAALLLLAALTWLRLTALLLTTLLLTISDLDSDSYFSSPNVASPLDPLASGNVRGQCIVHDSFEVMCPNCLI